jgi:4-amino-4-deoxy-L-arabinose transferase-like glycosyltransferase
LLARDSLAGVKARCCLEVRVSSDASAPSVDASPLPAQPSQRRADVLVEILITLVFAAHLAIANLPPDHFIFDEAYYVPAARALLANQPSNLEHPPLAKAMIAGSIRLFGDHGFAWRLPSIVFGTLGVWFLYLLGLRLADRRTALTAAFLLAFESLWFIHSSIAMLDVPAVSLGLLGLLLFVGGRRVWAGVAVGLAMLAKEVAVLFAVVLTLFAWLDSPDPRSGDAVRRAARSGGLVTAAALVVFLAGMQAYDSATGAAPSAFDHLARMYRHNQAIAAPPPGDAVRPFQWFSGFPPSGYLLTFTELAGGAKRYYVQYFGQPNLVVTLMVWLALPAALVTARRGNRHSTLHLLAFLVPFACFFALAAWRITYPYYMLFCLPSLCALVASFAATLPRPVAIGYAAGVVLWFLTWFPRNLLTLGR